MDSLVALVTGGSSGIGRESVLALQAGGATVYAAARREMPDLQARGVRALAMDVTDEDSLQAGVSRILDETGRIDVLVNNAGYGSYGAIEDVPMAEARRQFDVNVFGAMRLTQLILPTMIAQGRGRIINISSMGGRFSMALGGWYHATKYAVEALSDALRQEVRPFGIEVVLVEPGLIHTEWTKIAADHLLATSGMGKYAVIAENFAAALRLAGPGTASDPSVIGRTVARAATCAHPRTRYRKGLGAIPLTVLTDLLPDRVYDAGVRLLLTHLGGLIGLIGSPTRSAVTVNRPG